MFFFSISILFLFIIIFRTLVTKSAATVALSDLELNKDLVSIPQFSLEQYQRPENNIIHLSGKQTEDFDKTLLSAMFFGKEHILQNIIT